MHQVDKIDYHFIRMHGQQNVKKPDIVFLGQCTDYLIPNALIAVDPGKIVQTLGSVFCLPVQNILYEERYSYILRTVGICIPQQIFSLRQGSVR